MQIARAAEVVAHVMKCRKGGAAACAAEREKRKKKNAWRTAECKRSRRHARAARMYT